MTNQNSKQGQAQDKQVKIADNLPGAEYANAMQVNHNKDEFQMMFLSIMGPSGKVASKVITSPGHFKRIIAAMQENLKKYESRFGEVQVAEGPIDKEIGFKG